MARPLQTGLDYFPLDTNIDDTIELLEAKFGLEGFAIFIKLLQKIYSNNYYLDWNEEIKLLFAKKNSLNIDSLNNVLNYCLEKNILNNTLFLKYSILTSSGIQSRYFKAIERRKNIKIINEYILVDLKRINAAMDLINVNINSLNVNINSQSKVNYSKEEEIKRNDIDISMPFTPPDDIKSIQIIFSDWNNIICKQYPEFQKITESEFEMDIKLQQLLFKLKDKWETAEILTLYGTNEWLRLNAKFLKWWNINNYEKALQGKFVSYKQNTATQTESAPERPFIDTANFDIKYPLEFRGGHKFMEITTDKVGNKVMLIFKAKQKKEVIIKIITENEKQEWDKFFRMAQQNYNNFVDEKAGYYYV